MARCVGLKAYFGPTAASPRASRQNIEENELGIYRIGQIVPSSNTTMETEIPAMLRAREAVEPERFTFHSSRMRMQKVTKEELEAMDRGLRPLRRRTGGRARRRARLRMPGRDHEYGKGLSPRSEERLQRRTREAGGAAPVVTSAGALVDGLKTLGAKRVSILAPYMKPLTKLVDRLHRERRHRSRRQHFTRNSRQS